ncbi:MAG: hypothetical protein K9M99_12640 [Candidatus Cloacimonetes bacterium]|nr:hypothetical protein [Candidatus Cloacimonadota bacterium]
MIICENLNLFIEENIADIPSRMVLFLGKLEFEELLKQDNPFVYKTKYFNTASEIIKALMETCLSALEDALVDGFLQKLAIYINVKVRSSNEYNEDNSNSIQKYWEYISGGEDFYKRVIDPVCYKVKKRNNEFMEQYFALLNKFTAEFIREFCLESGATNWGKLIEFNSSRILS